ncbi:MAG: ABC transporter permease subunit [Actinomycetota bacterium]|nr:ABC transporter permease subunit [Actinomycetota bacterium]
MGASATEARTRLDLEKLKAKRPPGGGRKWLAPAFMAPALVLLGALVVYPTIDTVAQSFQADDTRAFVGIDNYKEIFETDRILTAIKNNVIWVATAPAIITGLGLLFALLTERVRYATAVKIVVFMPMAISFLATGVLWRLMYQETPTPGTLNAAIGKVTDTVSPPGPYPAADVLPDSPWVKRDGAIVTKDTVGAGDATKIGLVGLTDADLPEEAVQAEEVSAPDGGVAVTVWRDFKPGGGKPGVIEQGELSLPGATVALVDSNGATVASDTTQPNGTVTFSDVGGGEFRAEIAPSTFDPGFTGINWLSSGLVTPAIIGAFCWMWAGFSVVVIGAGLSALPRDVLEAARVDGANEWQVFRNVTLPLLAPVLGVVFVTLIINVLKIFDIVFVTAPGSFQDDANVIALEMWRTSFTAQRYGVGSAVAVLLFILVIPVMVLNIRRFRR